MVIKAYILDCPLRFKDVQNSLAEIIVRRIKPENMLKFLNGILDRRVEFFYDLMNERPEFLALILEPLEPEQIVSFLTQEKGYERYASNLAGILYSPLAAMHLINLLNKKGHLLDKKYLPDLLIAATGSPILLSTILKLYAPNDVIDSLFGRCIFDRDEYFKNAMQLCARSPSGYSPTDYYGRENRDSKARRDEKLLFVSIINDYMSQQDSALNDKFLNALTRRTMQNHFLSNRRENSILYESASRYGTPGVCEALLKQIPKEFLFDILFAETEEYGVGNPNTLLARYGGSYEGNLLLMLPEELRLKGLVRHFFTGFNGRHMGHRFVETVKSIVCNLKQRVECAREVIPYNPMVLSIAGGKSRPF